MTQARLKSDRKKLFSNGEDLTLTEVEKGEESFCDFFKKIAKKHAQNKAVIFNQSVLSYSQLDKLSTQLAHNLIKEGVQPGDIVALGLYNDLDLIIALLSVWQANGVYLPIDPNYPKERIGVMLADASPKLLITKRETVNKFSFFKGKKFIIEKLQNKDQIQQVDLEKVKLHQLAYIMYTSGSTGKPKGIMVDHVALKHAALAYKELHPDRHISLISGSISFDPSLLTIIHSLVTGGTICLFDNRKGIDVKSSKEIIDTIKKNNVSFILSTPSFYSNLVNENIPLLSLKNVDLCGEKVSKKLLIKHIKIAPNATLCNAYGPTEYAIGATAAILYDSEKKKINKVSVGKGFSANKIYILDSNFNRVEQGQKGEIFIGGPGLAKGYMNLRKLNREKFLCLDTLEDEPVRVYRTGDLGYYLPDGNIEFLGRSDFQVKINGHRVELEEVEHVINGYSSVDRSIVITKEYLHEGKKLIAFFSSSDKLLEKRLKDYLLKKLPSYMIPCKFIQIKSWPVTKNGKIDRKYLSKMNS